MYFVYSLLLTIGFLVLSPRFLFDAFRHGKYVAGFRERLGLLTPLKNQRPVIWLHCVSVGEAQAARPLVQALKRDFPDHSVVVSTITVTGQQVAREVFKDSAERVFYFPFDWGFTVARSLERINPLVVLLMETELWPGFLRQCAQRGIPVALVNGRISERSCRRYQAIKPFISRVLRLLKLAVMQTDEDAARLKKLGMREDKVLVSGNLKFDAGMIPLASAVTEDLRNKFASTDQPLIIAASTHAPEERLLIDAFRNLQIKARLNPRLMIAPRHPERFDEVASLMASSGFSWTRRSSPDQSDGKTADLILLDTIGELPSAYPLASIVFVGGSIAKHGGHNILEPAAVGSCIVTGAHTHNFATIVNTFLENDAIIQLPPLDESQASAELAYVINELLADPQRQESLRRRARTLVEENRGATDRTLSLITPLIKQTAKQAPVNVAVEKAHSA